MKVKKCLRPGCCINHGVLGRPRKINYGVDMTCPGCAGSWHPSSECPVYSPNPIPSPIDPESSSVAIANKVNQILDYLKEVK